MSNKQLRIATRESPLALWQANYVADLLRQHHPDLQVQLVPMTTRGDQILNSPLAKVGGKGLFIKELEVAMLEDRADIAVHSMKDVPMEFPEGLGLAVICEREDYRDAFVSNKYTDFESLPQGAVVGSSSLRRQCQLKALRPDIKINDLRGNVNTRLKKLDDGDYDAIILAAAGLMRLGMSDRISQLLDPAVSLPAGGQGAVGIESRIGDSWVNEILQPLNHEATALCVKSERAMNCRLNGGCQVPIACLANLQGTGADGRITIKGLVGSIDGKRILQSENSGAVADAEKIGAELAENLLAAGAGEILAALSDD